MPSKRLNLSPASESPPNKAKLEESSNFDPNLLYEALDVFKNCWFDFFDNKTLIAFSQTHKAAWEATKYHREKRVASKMMHAVVWGDEDKARELIEANPVLALSKRGEATDPSGRTFKNISAFQAALCAGDTQMCKMIQRCMDQQGLLKQFNEIFQHGIDAHLAQQEQDAFNFDDVFAAIKAASNAKCNALLEYPTDITSVLGKAIAKFRADFDEKSKSEQIFNPQHLLKLYNKYSEQYNSLRYDQRVAVSRLIIGFVQRYLPANYAQAFVMGLANATNNKLKRRLQFNYDNASFYPLVPNSALGFRWYVYPWQRGAGAWAGEWSLRESGYELYHIQKQQSYRAYPVQLEAGTINRTSLK